MFLLNNKINNFKIIGFWSLVLIVFLNVFFLNQKIVTENDISKNNVYEYVDQNCIIDDQDVSILQRIQSENFEIDYIDNLDWKSKTSLDCFGEILLVQINENNEPYFDLNSYEYKQRKDFIIQINYNPFVLYLNIVFQFLFTLFVIFFTKTKDYHLHLILFASFFIYVRYIFFINKGFGTFGSTGVNPSELKYDFFIIFLLFFLKKQINNRYLVTLLLLFTLIKPSLLVFVLIILFIKYKYKFRFTPLQNFIFLSLPIIREVIRFVSSLSKKYDPIWLSTIQDPISGVQRYPDMWLTLGPLKCQFYENYSTFFYFSDYKFSCPANFYSPVFRYIKFPFDVWNGVIFTSFLFLVFFIIIYLNLLKNYPQYKYLVSIFFLTPVMNFLFYEGNFDILTFILAFLALKNYKKYFVFKSALILLVSLLEIHTVPILFGLLLASVLKRELKVFSTNLSFLFIFTYFIFNDSGTSSIRSQFFTTSNYDLGSFANVGNQGVGYGVLLDLKQFLIFSNINQYVLILISFIILLSVSLLNIKYKKVILQSDYKKLLSESYLFYGYFFWFIFTLMLSNQSYRLANFLPFLLLVFVYSNNSIKYLVLLSITLTPSTQIYGDIFNSLEIFIQRAGLYSLAVYLTSVLFIDVLKKFVATKKFSNIISV